MKQRCASSSRRKFTRDKPILSAKHWSQPRVRSLTTSTLLTRKRTKATLSRACPKCSAFRHEQIATIGDMPNDMAMFEKAGSASRWVRPVKK